MNTDVTVAMISGATTIVVGVLTAFVAYKGSVKGATEQIEHAQENLNKEIARQNKFATAAIEKFVIHEVKKNFSRINNDTMKGNLKKFEQPFQHLYGDPSFDYSEFNRVKYDLIKFESDIVDEIINIYDVFYLIERKQDINKFTQNEYDSFKITFNMCLKKYV